MFFGPAGSIYEGGFFKALMKFPADFPSLPPTLTFVTPIMHPNIYPDGKVCISILHAPGVDPHNEQESADERWRPILGVESILISVLSMLTDEKPNLDSPANIDAARLFRTDEPSYKKQVRKLVRCFCVFAAVERSGLTMRFGRCACQLRSTARTESPFAWCFAHVDF